MKNYKEVLKIFSPTSQTSIFCLVFLAKLRTLPANLLKVLKVKDIQTKELKGRLSYIPNIKCFFRDLFSQAAEKIFQIEKAWNDYRDNQSKFFWSLLDIILMWNWRTSISELTLLNVNSWVIFSMFLWHFSESLSLNKMSLAS